MHVLARARLVLARHPSLYWSAAAVLAAGAALVAADAAAGVDEARRSWGETRTVVLALGPVAPGAPLAGSTEVRAVPLPLVPADALAALTGAEVARQHLTAGEIVVAHDVAATSGPAALVPDGWRGVPVREPVPSGASVGDRVAVVAGGVELAADAVVVGHLPDGLVVAVPHQQAPQVAQASASGELVVVLRPG